MTKLTENHIEKIYLFVQQHFVEWYDVQVELVDHLANGIEQQWLINNSVPFEEALRIEFKKFGVFGFQDLVEQKIKALNIIYRKEIWSCFKGCFVFPKAILIFFSVWFLCTLLNSIPEKMYVLIPLFVLLNVAYFYQIINLKRLIRHRKVKTGKQWLFDTSIIEMGGLGIIFNNMVHIHLFVSEDNWSSTINLLAAIAIVLFVLLFYVSTKTVPEKFKANFIKQYPEYNLAL